MNQRETDINDVDVFEIEEFDNSELRTVVATHRC